jgi:hypothetical protein
MAAVGLGDRMFGDRSGCCLAAVHCVAFHVNCCESGLCEGA